MNSLTNQFKILLEEKLDENFPKGETQDGKKLPCRSKALVLFAEAVVLFEELTKKNAREEKFLTEKIKEIEEMWDKDAEKIESSATNPVILKIINILKSE